MFVEGKGEKAPKPVIIILNEFEVRSTRSRAKQIALMRSYSEDNAFLGWLGQAAVGKWLLETIGIRWKGDFKNYRYSDGGMDFPLFGKKYEIKSTRQQTSLNPLPTPLKADRYVFCRNVSVLTAPIQQVALLGWIDRRLLCHYSSNMYPGWPIEIKLEWLEPMERLLDHIRADCEREKYHDTLSGKQKQADWDHHGSLSR